MWWPGSDDAEPEYLARQYAAAPVKPLRFSIGVGVSETGNTSDISVDAPTTSVGPSLLIANRHLRTVLQAKGYRLHYTEHIGGHDWLCWHHALPTQLLAVLGEAG